ncbi:MAG: hypothetical protein K6F68_06665 [Clostridiales bacterium]|nr:hypothetical protein [Clostridiales bacterium]
MNNEKELIESAGAEALMRSEDEVLSGAAAPLIEEAEPEKTADAQPDNNPAADVAENSDEAAPAREEVNRFGWRIKKPYHERAYLLYGEEGSESKLALEETKSFLVDLGFDGGELRQARKGMGLSDANRENNGRDESMMYCSYCGREIPGVDYYRMPDGRLRCTNCSRTIVRTKDELAEIYNRVVLNMEVFFGASLNVPVQVEMLEERKLKKKLKRPLSEVDDKSMLILGAAVNKKKDYSILLENGAPRISVTATFAHELTHIWQYTHWDNVKGFPKCPEKARLLIYEGMAKWVEIQYLYLIGESSVARREEAFTRERKDEYGVGFCLYESRYPLSREAMLCGDTPFTTDRYPID